MTTYTIQGPSGRSYTIEGPEGATADQLGQAVLAQSHDERVAATTAQMRAEYNPTNGMGTGERLVAAAGRGMASVGRGLGQLVGHTSQADIDEAKHLDAPLLATTAGKVGNAVGMAGTLTPLMLVPGVNGVVGASAIGGTAGALTTEGGLADRAEGALDGAAGGALGVGVGRALSAGAGMVKASLATRAAARAPQRAAVQAAQDAGYVLPPVEVAPTVPNALAQMWSGPVKTTQAAAVKNQGTTNVLAARALGLPEDQPITTEALGALRTQAGQAYRDVAGAGKFNAVGADLPASVPVTRGLGPDRMTTRTTVDAQDLVAGWKQANADSAAYFRQYARDANPETLAKAKAARDDAATIHGFLSDSLEQAGQGDSVAALGAARVKIAKSYDVERALQGSGVDANALARMQKKNPRLTNELAQIAETAANFPKAMKRPTEAVSPYSAVDGMASMGSLSMAAATGHPLAALGAAASAMRPAVRAAILTPAGQKLATLQLGPTTANALVKILQAQSTQQALTVRGIAAGVSLAGSPASQQ